MSAMKKSVIFSLIIGMLFIIPANGQVGKFLKNVKNNVKQDLLGTPEKKNTPKSMPEPSCACETSDLVLDIGKYQIEYTETSISILDDGRVLLRDNINDTYYIASNGVAQGPMKKDDPRVAQFQAMVQGPDNHASFLDRYKEFISKKGDKFLITFGGKSYGPYALISKFAVSSSRDKFAAMVTQTNITTEDEAKKMEAEVNNAKTDEEKIQISIKYSQLMQQRMMDGGGPKSMLPQLVSNMPVASPENLMMMAGATLYTNLKYDEILFATMQKVSDLQGKTLISISDASCTPESLFIKSDNSGYACYSYGTLTFSDGKKLTDLFNAHLIKADGKIYLAYMYYSPKKNAIVQCKIPF